MAREILKNLPGGKDKIEPIPEGPPFPDLLDYLWEWWKEFALGIPTNGMGPPTALWNDVQQWCAAVRIELEPWEKKTLVTLAYCRAVILSQ